MWLIVGTFLYGAKALSDQNVRRTGVSKWDVDEHRNLIMARIFWIPTLAVGIVCVVFHLLG
jgi:hypothetical protein